MLKAEKRVGFILHVGIFIGLSLLMNDVHAISIGGSVNCLPGFAKNVCRLGGKSDR